MTFVAPRLVLVTPVVTDIQAVQPALTEAFARGQIASLILRLGPADERTLINRIKALAPIAQAEDAAVLVAFGSERHPGHDPAQIATRGGADGVHVSDIAELRTLRERYRDGHILGAGGFDTKHEAMEAGEIGADYILFGDPDRPASGLAFTELTERVQWWAEIFEPPCVALAPSLAAIAELAETGTEFIALSDAVWRHADGPQAAIAAALETLERMEDALR